MPSYPLSPSASSRPQEATVASAIWRYRWWILLLALVAGAAGYGFSQLLPTRYQAEARIQVISSQQLEGDPLGADELLQLTNTYAEQADTSPVLTAAYRRTGSRGDYQAFVDSLEAEVAQSGGLIVLSATEESRDVAADRANAYARAFTDAITDLQTAQQQRTLERIQQTIDANQQQLRANPSRDKAVELQTRLDALEARSAQEVGAPQDSARILQPALPPDSASSPKPLRNGILAAIAALALGILVAYMRPRLSSRYSDPDDAAADLELPVVARIPVAQHESPEAIEAFRQLRINVEVLLRTVPVDSRRTTILVVGPVEGVGKSHITTNLALSLARQGLRTVAVDGDLRAPSLHEFFRTEQAPGLSELLVRPTHGQVAEFVQPVTVDELESYFAARLGERDEREPLSLIPSGRPTPEAIEGLSSQPMEDALARLQREFDYGVIDSPPLLPVADGAALSTLCGGVLLVYDPSTTKRKDLRAALQILRQVGAPVLGLVANRVTGVPQYGAYGAVPQVP